MCRGDGNAGADHSQAAAAARPGCGNVLRNNGLTEVRGYLPRSVGTYGETRVLQPLHT